MSGDYYNHAPPGSNQYPHPPPPQEYGRPPPQYSGQHGYDAAQGNHFSQSQNEYSNYQQPRDEGYRSSPSHMQVAPYRDPYDDERRHSREYEAYNTRHGSSGGYYPPPPTTTDYNRQGHSHERRRGRDDLVEREDRESARGGEAKSHDKKKDLGASILGGVVGAFAGHEVGGKDGLTTLLGAAAGAFGGHELEKHREKEKDKRKDGEGQGHHHGHREVKYSDPYNNDGYSSSEEDQRRHHHQHHASDR